MTTTTRPMHRNDHGVVYDDRPVRPMPGHNPKDEVGQCPTCSGGHVR